MFYLPYVHFEVEWKIYLLLKVSDCFLKKNQINEDLKRVLVRYKGFINLIKFKKLRLETKVYLYKYTKTIIVKIGYEILK